MKDVEAFLQIDGGTMRLRRMDRIRSSTSGNNAALVHTNPDNVADSAIGDAFKYIRAMREQISANHSYSLRAQPTSIFPDGDCGALAAFAILTSLLQWSLGFIDGDRLERIGSGRGLYNERLIEFFSHSSFEIVAHPLRCPLAVYLQMTGLIVRHTSSGCLRFAGDETSPVAICVFVAIIGL